MTLTIKSQALCDWWEFQRNLLAVDDVVATRVDDVPPPLVEQFAQKLADG